MQCESLIVADKQIRGEFEKFRAFSWNLLNDNNVASTRKHKNLDNDTDQDQLLTSTAATHPKKLHMLKIS